MSYDRRRAALLSLSALALVLAGALFPAAGFGSVPAGAPSIGGVDSSGGGGPAAPDGGTAGPDATTRSDAPGTTATPPSSGDGTDGTPTASTDDSDAGGATDTDRPTTTSPPTTTTTAAPADGDGGDDGALDALVTNVVLLVLAIAGIAAVAIVAAVLAGGSADRDSGDASIGGLPSLGILDGLAGIPRSTMLFVVDVSRNTPQVLDGLATGIGGVVGGLGDAITGSSDALATAGSALVGGLGTAVVSVPRGLAGGLLSAPSGVGDLLSGLGSDPSSPASRTDARTATGVDPEESDSGPPPLPDSVEAAWRELEARLPARGADARTPAELARLALERGYPESAVDRLTTVFREVAYGSRPQTDERVAAARSAIEAIRDAGGEEE